MKKSDLKNIICEILVDSLNEELSLDEDMNTDAEYHRGFKWGLKHRIYGGDFDDEQLKQYPK